MSDNGTTQNPLVITPLDPRFGDNIVTDMIRLLADYIDAEGLDTPKGLHATVTMQEYVWMLSTPDCGPRECGFETCTRKGCRSTLRDNL